MPLNKFFEDMLTAKTEEYQTKKYELCLEKRTAKRTKKIETYESIINFLIRFKTLLIAYGKRESKPLSSRARECLLNAISLIYVIDDGKELFSHRQLSGFLRSILPCSGQPIIKIDDPDFLHFLEKNILPALHLEYDRVILDFSYIEIAKASITRFSYDFRRSHPCLETCSKEQREEWAYIIDLMNGFDTYLKTNSLSVLQDLLLRIQNIQIKDELFLRDYMSHYVDENLPREPVYLVSQESKVSFGEPSRKALINVLRDAVLPYLYREWANKIGLNHPFTLIDLNKELASWTFNDIYDFSKKKIPLMGCDAVLHCLYEIYKELPKIEEAHSPSRRLLVSLVARRLMCEERMRDEKSENIFRTLERQDRYWYYHRLVLFKPEEAFPYDTENISRFVDIGKKIFRQKLSG